MDPEWPHELHEAPLDAREKGVPGLSGRVALSDVGKRNWRLFAEDLPLPVAVIKTSALHNNSSWMKSFADAQNVRLAPHGKTTMCPTLFDLQFQDGAWALTVATPHQLQVARSFGYRRIVLANQLVGKSAIEWVVEELERCPDFEFYCLLDSAENLEQLALIARCKKLSQPLNVLIEIGFNGGRTGCRSVEQGLHLASLVAKNQDVLALRGVEGYEGVVRGGSDEDTISRIDAFLDMVIECAHQCAQQQLFAEGEVLLTAGGSAYFDRVSAKLGKVDLKRPTIALLRGGCYLIHDHTMFARSFEKIRARSAGAANIEPGLLPALEVWSYVQSMPEPGRVIASLGKRDVSFDELPIPIKWYRPNSEPSVETAVAGDYSVSHLNDQHCYVNVPLNCPWEVGDMLGFGISHPCLTFDKWRVIYLVDDDYRITGAVRTYF
jgi:D-serine dehydratase